MLLANSSVQIFNSAADEAITGTLESLSAASKAFAGTWNIQN